MKFSTTFIAATREYTTWYQNVPAPAFRRAFTLGKAKSAALVPKKVNVLFIVAP